MLEPEFENADLFADAQQTCEIQTKFFEPCIPLHSLRAILDI